MFETPFVTVTVETMIGVRVTTLTVDGSLSSVMTSGAFSSCALVLAYRAWSTAVTVTGPRITLVPAAAKAGVVVASVCGAKVLNGLKPNVASRLVCAVAERLNPFCPQGRRPIHSGVFVAGRRDADHTHLDGNLAPWHINGSEVASDLRDHGLIIAHDDRVDLWLERRGTAIRCQKMAEHALDILRLGMQVLQLVSILLLGQRGDLILGERVNGAAFLIEHQVVLQRQFTDVIQRVTSFEKFAGHSDRIEGGILEKLEIRLTRQVLVQVVQRVVVEPETVARVECWVSWFAVRGELGRRRS